MRWSSQGSSARSRGPGQGSASRIGATTAPSGYTCHQIACSAQAGVAVMLLAWRAARAMDDQGRRVAARVREEGLEPTRPAWRASAESQRIPPDVRATGGAVAPIVA